MPKATTTFGIGLALPRYIAFAGCAPAQRETLPTMMLTPVLPAPPAVVAA